MQSIYIQDCLSIHLSREIKTSFAICYAHEIRQFTKEIFFYLNISTVSKSLCARACVCVCVQVSVYEYVHFFQLLLQSRVRATPLRVCACVRGRGYMYANVSPRNGEI